MDAGIFNTIVFSLLSALVSSFLASYLTYKYTELSWRKRRHLEDIKTNCLSKILRKIEDFESLFGLSEGKIAVWVKNESFFKELPSSAWCVLFSFGFDEPPTTHYKVLLHDLKNHFPNLVKELREFETKIKELCQSYNELLYEITKIAYKKANSITGTIPGKDVLTEVVVMSLAGYKEWDYPNNAKFLRERGLYKYVDKIIEDLKHNHAKLVDDLVNVRNTGLSMTMNVKKSVIEALHTQELSGKCSLY